MRFGIVVVGGIAVAATLLVAPAEAKSPPMTITGPDLPYQITAPFPDQAAFWDANGKPARLAASPTELGPGYEVASWYWMASLAENQGLAGTVIETDDVGVYYPDCAWPGRVPCERGVVRITAGSEARWLMLDEERDAILRRYVRLGRADALPPEPTVVEVVAAAVAGGEAVVVEAYGRLLSSEDARLFWQELTPLVGRSRPMEYAAYARQEDQLLLTFHLPEGRVLRERYLRAEACFCPAPTGDGFGETVTMRALPVTASLASLLAQVQPPTTPAAARPSGGGTSVPAWTLVTSAAAATAVLAATLGGVALRRRVLRTARAD